LLQVLANLPDLVPIMNESTTDKPMTEHRAAHIAWLKHRLATEAMDEWTRCQVLAALSLAQG